MKILAAFFLPIITAFRMQDCSPNDLQDSLTDTTWTLAVADGNKEKYVDYFFGKDNKVRSAESGSSTWSYKDGVFLCNIMGQGTWTVYKCKPSYIVLTPTRSIDTKTTTMIKLYKKE